MRRRVANFMLSFGFRQLSHLSRRKGKTDRRATGDLGGILRGFDR